jgi:hypothetical protein
MSFHIVCTATLPSSHLTSSDHPPWPGTVTVIFANMTNRSLFCVTPPFLSVVPHHCHQLAWQSVSVYYSCAQERFVLTSILTSVSQSICKTGPHNAGCRHGSTTRNNESLYYGHAQYPEEYSNKIRQCLPPWLCKARIICCNAWYLYNGTPPAHTCITKHSARDWTGQGPPEGDKLAIQPRGLPPVSAH